MAMRQRSLFVNAISYPAKMNANHNIHSVKLYRTVLIKFRYTYYYYDTHANCVIDLCGK